MFKKVGRIVSRGKVAGLFIPFDNGLYPGIYEITEILGELQIKRIGNSSMPKARRDGLDLNSLFDEKELVAMTSEELQSINYLHLQDRKD